METRYREHLERLASAGQEHLPRFWDELDDAQRALLLDDLDQVDLERCTPLIDSLVRRGGKTGRNAGPTGGKTGGNTGFTPSPETPGTYEPVDALPATPTGERVEAYAAARRRGVETIRAGRVAAFMVAGGQGTRLGYDGPKGAFRISPLRDAPLFQLFAEQLLGVERRYGTRPAWYIMTSPQNHAATVEFFEANNHFGLSRGDVVFFRQGQMPAFDREGRILLAERHRVALSPDGHGGSLYALRASGALEEMRRRGVDTISYFQVDNPLVHAIDPLFIGLHETSGSEFSSKAVTKADDLERVGNFVKADGKPCVIEYSDLPEATARARNSDGSRRFDAGSIAIHVFNRELVERLTAPGSEVRLPWHRAEKKAPTVDESGRPVTPSEPNAVKVEMFVFDAIPLARDPMVLYTPREEEFSPVKNAEGVDSVATAKRDMVRRAARWLEACGVDVPRDEHGEPAAMVEISPAYALDVEDLRGRVAGSAVRVERGGRLLLDEAGG
jgi:UDP-N-acetylglucosamine/UDP-N-acetylgalactosamine diphosphorylase